MNSGFIPLAGGPEKVASYRNHERTSQADIGFEEEDAMPSFIEPLLPQEPFTPQERRKLIANELAMGVFAAQPSFSSSSFPDASHQFKSWVDVISSDLTRLAEKVVQAERKTQVRVAEEVRLRKYLIQCWQNLENSFQQFYQKIQQNEPL